MKTAVLLDYKLTDI